MTMLHEHQTQCPYCGETFTSLIDISAGAQEYIEDCEICCQPIVFRIELDTMDDIPIVTIKRDND